MNQLCLLIAWVLDTATVVLFFYLIAYLCTNLAQQSPKSATLGSQLKAKWELVHISQGQLLFNDADRDLGHHIKGDFFPPVPQINYFI